ncbi:MAG TPA: alkaline phosphatase family protein [Gemmatimonadaceae bacterium]|nr:alkaline phosphatase family protein [Gemmatimonadaceae bacterium]
MPTLPRFLVARLAAASLVILPSVARAQATRADSATRPTLVVLITVDQLRGDYYDRFRPQLHEGLARLYEHGAVFTNAHQDHGVTETAPGHASTLSGRFPRGTGIVMNAAGVGDPQAPLVGGGGPGASPFRFRGSTLTDWMRLHDPRTRALSVSRKDRGAILPIGRPVQDVYWYASDGRFTTSTYYADTLPDWVKAFNARHLPQSYAGRSWTPLLPDSAYAEPDSVPQESNGREYAFPHVLSSDPAQAAGDIIGFPWMDDLIADAALAGVQAMQLGDGPETDVLAVSFSTTDAVGHRFGPDSRELHDQILRLDRVIGRFLDSLFTLRDSSRVLVALTADHGVTPLPGVRSHDAGNGEGHFVSLRPLLLHTDSALQRRGVPAGAIDADGSVIFLDRPALARAGVPADSVMAAVLAAARRIPGVARAETWQQLSRADTVHDDVARRWLHMYPPDLAPDGVVTLEPFSILGTGSSFHHGSPHDTDTHVPVVFYGPAFATGRFDRYARVVDIAPTLAAVLGVPPTEPLDGRVLEEALKR